MQPRRLTTAIRSVVKIHTVSNPPDYEQPWRSKGPSSSTGSGVVIETKKGLRVLTNAHVTEYQVFIEIQRHGVARKFIATVEGVGHDCDLALLAVEDQDFFDGVVPIKLGALPQLSDRVSACGFPIGGDHISITAGVVSRIELASYAQSQRLLIAVQIDAAINAGNSGGPVLKGGRLVGIAFQALDEGQNIGYMIGMPVVEHFLRDLERGGELGFPDLGIKTQALESRAHRRALRLPKTLNGVLVNQVVHGGSVCGTLEVGDVLLAVDGIELAADGTVPFSLDTSGGQMIHYSYLPCVKHVGDTIDLSVWRKGERVECTVSLLRPNQLVVEIPDDLPPRYFLFGGILFAPLTRDYLQSWGDDWSARAPHQLMALYEDGIVTPDCTEVVVLQRVLPDVANQGYHDLENLVIRKVGGRTITCLKDLVTEVESSKHKFVDFETAQGQHVVLERRRSIQRAPALLERFVVPRDRSRDLISESPT